MPTNLDIYGLTKHRNLQTLDRFIERYVDREASEDREGEELRILRLDYPGVSDSDQFYEWEPAVTLFNAIQRGLDYPRRCFPVYLTGKQGQDISALLHFTTDDQLVLGLGIDDEGYLPQNQERSELLLSHLAEEFGCHLGLITVEDPPPDSELEFREAVKTRPLVAYFRDFTTGSTMHVRK